MTSDHIKRAVETRATNNVRIADELAEVIVWACNKGYTAPNDDSAKTKAFVDNCTEATYNRLERLNDLGLLYKIDKGPKTYIIHERRDEIVNGENLGPLVDEEIRRVCAHMKRNPLVEWVVAIALREPDPVSALPKGPFSEKQENLREAVRAIEESPAVSKDDYGAVIFRNSANEYQATQKAVNLKQK